MIAKKCVHVGVDVGGTNTDAVVLYKGEVLGYGKQPTARDVTTGISRAVASALFHSSFGRGADRGPCEPSELEVMRVHIGTTHFVNAVAQKQDLAPVAVIRLCKPASISLPPFSDFPEDLQKVVAGPVHMISGGHYFDGRREISPLNKGEVTETLTSIQASGIKNIVVSGIFSPVNNEHELQVGEWIKEIFPEASFTLSHKIAHIDILLRENSAIINESLKPLAHRTVDAIRKALNGLRLHCPFYLTQNDGTLLSAEKAKEMPVLTFASGPTNSMRGAAFLSGVKDGVVVDIGGTTTDAGMLMNGFPRQSSTKVEICRIKTNFQMPDTVTIALGGGSVIKFVEGEEHKVMIGPKSVGYNIHKAGIVFGGHTLTATDLAVAADIADVGTFQHQLEAHYIPEMLVKSAMSKIQNMLENLIDSVKTSEEQVPVILVGGGTILVPEDWKPASCSQILRPQYYQVANAIGAALSQVSGSIDTIENISHNSREDAIANAKQQAIALAKREGADPETVEIVSISDLPLTYVPGNVTRIIVKAVGDLMWETETPGVMWHPEHADSMHLDSDEHMDETGSDVAHGHIHQLSPEEFDNIPVDESPNIDQQTGEWKLSVHDIESLAIGVGIMGCGGGGSPILGKLRATKILKEGKQIRIINPDRFCRLAKPTDIMLPVGYMGAPTVWMEMLINGVDSKNIIQATDDLYSYDNYNDCSITNKENNIISTAEGIKYIEDYKCRNSTPYIAGNEGKAVTAICSFEAGGCNCLIPLFMGAELDLPIVDFDLMGRAFPELQMITSAMNGHPPHPACVGDIHGKLCVCLESDSPKRLEDHFRQICVDFGCMAGLSMSPLTAKDIPGRVIKHSTSRAWRLGQAVLNARKQKTSPIDAILNFGGGIMLFTAKICDVERQTQGGFAKGQMRLDGFGESAGNTYLIKFQNEYLIARHPMTDKTLATTPDLITIVDSETGEPIPTDEIRYGLRVAVLALPAPPLLTSPQALAVVGPKAFGYKEDYISVGKFIDHKPVPPP